MLGDRDAQATVAVKDLKVARPFYEEILGLTPLPSDTPSVQGFKAGASVVLVYESDFAGSNKATVLTWSLGEAFEDAVQALKAKGIVFERYDLPGMSRDGDVHVSGGMRVVWFKDPDGNILSLGNY
ncbi:VOC family protein [Caulobacter sp. FWC2]|uniref:VOC family protein n=1 Tax=Caulobacter sp. FWC2 TaxID=69664 RepID=UPI000C14CFE4|nr:VOC family protein [Caulobacter sp. FWC2]PIB93706.1 glyoxalase [Caulobacter sp. FWC2]